MRILRKEIEYCDECPYRWQSGNDGKFFCSHPSAPGTLPPTRRMMINGANCEVAIIPKSCPLPKLEVTSGIKQKEKCDE